MKKKKNSDVLMCGGPVSLRPSSVCRALAVSGSLARLRRGLASLDWPFGPPECALALIGQGEV